MNEQEKLNQKLIYHSEYGDLENVKKLILQGADVHAQNDNALRWASFEGHLEVVKFLVERGANIHAKDNEALKFAAESGYLEMLKYFVLEHNCDAQIALSAAKEYETKEIISWCEKYIESKKEQEKLDKELIDFAYKGKLKEVKKLVEMGADIHSGNESALIAAAKYGYLEVVAYLLECGADVHAQDNKALFEASFCGKIELVKYLIEHGACINDRCFIYACTNGHLEVVKYLIEHDADIHAQNDWALKSAAKYGRLEVVQHLILEHSCDVKVALIAAREEPIQFETAVWCKEYKERKNLNDKLQTHLTKNNSTNKRMKV